MDGIYTLDNLGGLPNEYWGSGVLRDEKTGEKEESAEIESVDISPEEIKILKKLSRLRFLNTFPKFTTLLDENEEDLKNLLEKEQK